MIAKAQDLIDSLNEGSDRDKLDKRLNSIINPSKPIENKSKLLDSLIENAETVLEKEIAEAVNNLREVTEYSADDFANLIAEYCGKVKGKPFYMETKYHAFSDAIKLSCQSDEEEDQPYICENNIVGTLDTLYTSCKTAIVNGVSANTSDTQ